MVPIISQEHLPLPRKLYPTENWLILDFSDRTRTGISIMTSAVDLFLTIVEHFLFVHLLFYGYCQCIGQVKLCKGTLQAVGSVQAEVTGNIEVFRRSLANTFKVAAEIEMKTRGIFYDQQQKNTRALV